MSLPLSPKLLLDSTCTAKNIIPPPRCSFLFSFSPKKSISSFKGNQRMFLFLCLSHPPSKWRMARRETLRRCSILLEFLYLRYLVNRYRTSLRGPCRVFNAPIDPEGWNERWKFTSREKKRENFSTFSKFTPDSNKLEQFHCTMAEVCVLRHDPPIPVPRETQVSQVRPEVRVATDHGKSRRNRQATRLGGNLVAREATFTGVGEEIAVQDQLLSFLCVSSEPSRSA